MIRARLAFIHCTSGCYAYTTESGEWIIAPPRYSGEMFGFADLFIALMFCESLRDTANALSDEDVAKIRRAA